MNTSSSPFPPFLKGASRAVAGIAILAALAVGLLLSSVGPLQAQEEALEYPENGTAAVATFTAADPEGKSIVWSLEPGVGDVAYFSISDGVLTFNNPPDFEAAADIGEDNVYDVTVRAGDGGTVFAMEMVTVMVTNVDEPGTVMLSTLQPQVARPVTATLSDPDIFVVDSVEWEWFRGRNAIAGATNESYTPGSADVGYVLRATATYMDGEDADTEKSAQVESAHAVRAMPSSNIDPVFPNQNPGTGDPQTGQERKVAENTPADEDIGAPVAATDADVLTYSLEDDDVAFFSIDRATGQLKTKAALDHENEASYTVMVTAADPFGASATANVTIEVTDVDEAPSIPSAATSAIDHQENLAATTVLATAYTATDPEDNDNDLEWSLSGVDEGQFAIGEDNGELTFKAAPDFESPGDSNEDNVYEVTVVVTDSEGNSDELEVTVKVGNVEEGGEITLSTLQPRVGYPVTATLADPDNITADSVSWQWYRGSVDTEDTLPEECAETTADNCAIKGAASDTYTPVADDVGDTLTAVAQYTDGSPNDGDAKDVVGEPAAQLVLADTRNKAPVFPDQEDETDGEQTDQELTVPENTAADTDIGAPVAATDSEDTALDYTLGGTDAASFVIVRTTGQLQTKAKLDYETKDTYEVEVTATDSLGVSTTITVTINVGKVDEVPDLEGEAPSKYAENGTAPVATFTATDPEGASIVWMLGGANEMDFSIEGGVLEFTSSPDYESTLDNMYEVTVQASDGGVDSTAEKVVTIEVTNVEELGTVTLSTLQPQVGTPVTATLTDPDVAEAGTVVWKWSRGRNVIVTAIVAVYTPTVDDVGYTLRAEATYRDGEDEDKDKSANAASTRTVRALPSSNIDPVFPDQDPVAPGAQTEQEREVDENTRAGINLGAPVTASDLGDVLTYSLEGTDADSFSIDKATGQLKTKAALDHETKASYTVMVTATDPFGAPATATVTIEVTDVNEAPSVEGAASIDHDENLTVLDTAADGGGAQAATYTAIDLDEVDTTELSLEGADSSKFGIMEGLLAFNSAPDFESPADANQDNVYEVTVVVTDSEDSRGELEVTVKVGNVEELGAITLSAVQPRVGVPLTATLTDPDGDITDLVWQWSTSDGNIEEATSDTYEPVGPVGDDAGDGDVGGPLTVTATYTDGAGEAEPKDTATKSSEPNNVVADTRNKAPVFPDQDKDTEGPQTDQERSVVENTEPGTPIVTGEDGPVIAEDFITNNDGVRTAETLDYTLGGTDAASFSIDRGTAQLSTKAELDYEGKKSYTVEVTATDPSNATATVTVTIKVTDDDEVPVISLGGLVVRGQSSVHYAENGTMPVETYTADGPDAAMATWSLSGEDAGAFTIIGGVLAFRSVPDYENPTDMGGATCIRSRWKPTTAPT